MGVFLHFFNKNFCVPTPGADLVLDISNAYDRHRPNSHRAHVLELKKERH